MHVGEIFMHRYIVIQKLGWGHFSTVWLAKDLKYNTFVALKVQKSAPHYLEAAYDEVEILEQVSSYWKKDAWIESARKYIDLGPNNTANMDSCFSVQLLNSFLHYGPNGKHFVMVFEIMGVNLLDIIRRYDYKGIPIPLVRAMAKQVLIGLDYLHRICKIIHTDLKPENVLLSLTKEQINEIRARGQLGKRIKYRIPVYICGRNGEEEKHIEPKKSGEIIRKPSKQEEKSEAEEDDEEDHGKKERKNNVANETSALPNVLKYDPVTGRELTEQEIIKKQKRKIKKKKLQKKKKDRMKKEKEQKGETMDTTATSFNPGKEKQKKETLVVKEEEKKGVTAAGLFQQHQSDRKRMEVQAESGLEKPRSRSLPNMVASSETGAYSLEPIGDDFAIEIEEYMRLKTAHNKSAQLPNAAAIERPPEEIMQKPPVKVRNPIDENVKVKIVDLGNGCWTYHHFTSQIQTRQYRSPEVSKRT